MPGTISNLRPKYLHLFLWSLALYALVIFSLWDTGDKVYTYLHLGLDTSNAILSLLLAMFLLSERHAIQPNVRNYLVIGFGFAAGTELLHALVGIEWSGWFFWIEQYSSMLRPTTWPPSTYVLPLAMTWIYWLSRRNATLSPGLFAAGMGAVTLVLFALSFKLPNYADTGILGIQRPTQIPLLLLWVVVIVVYWRQRHENRLYEGLSLMGVLLLLSDLCMLYSTSPHEKFTMMAHAGKMIAYAMLHLIQMRIAGEDSQARTVAELALLEEQDRLRLALAEINKLALYDPLTNLANRRLLNDRIEQIQSEGKRAGRYTALIFIDLDKFKLLNDTYGHAAGDLLLIAAAQRIKNCVREADTVARFGGDEFVVALGGLVLDEVESTAQAKIIAEKIRVSLSETYRLIIKRKDGTEAIIEHQCTSSIGLAIFNNHKLGLDEVLKWADAAMYQAKEAGRNLIRVYKPKG